MSTQLPPLDHNATASQLKTDARILQSIRDTYCTTPGSKRAIQDIIDHTFGLADWHQNQATPTTPTTAN